MNCELDLSEVVQKCRNTEYNQKRFSAVIMRKKEPTKTTALIFRTGKIVITGAKSIEDSRNAAKHYASDIKKCCGYKWANLSEF